VYSVFWALEANTIASSSADGTLGLWDVETATPRLILPTSSVIKSLAITDDNRAVVGGCVDGQVKAWDLRTDDLAPYQVGQLREDGHSDLIFSVRILPGSGHGILTASADKTVKLWGLLPEHLLCGQTWVGHKVSPRLCDHPICRRHQP
jgi:WD40 repeat protein